MNEYFSRSEISPVDRSVVRAPVPAAAVQPVSATESSTEQGNMSASDARRQESFAVDIVAVDEDAAGADRYSCEDDDRLIIAAAAVQLGFTLRELRELMDLYDEASPARRALPNFMKLLASYQRLMAWRQPEGYDPPPAGRQRKPFRARHFRPEIVSSKEST